ncbi:PEPxxWA-CTERM sorting domain-containing protein [Sphingomonas sp. Leaf339]|uniref:PEPxxWA-CTERM sorting domain-containing protein n=1 Tax=Sphingomonas sp. Leaf339 TaxID=1736343 RepID=UPI0009E8482F|nr:PEPxxWA-CTERM sorting domain-containing protein [Sphingomonas sp. Leaf339]
MSISMFIKATGTSLAACLAIVAAPATAQNRYVFGGSDTEVAPRATITFDGTTTFAATDTGWISSAGEHQLGNANYITGSFASVRFNSWFNFALGAAAPLSPYTSAVLTLKSGFTEGVTSANPAALTLFDVNATLLELDAQRDSGDTIGQGLFTDLGSGDSYGSFIFSAPTVVGQTISISLNSNFLGRVNAGLVQDFSIGGTLTPSSIAAVPEPATWAMMLVGFAMVGGAARYRRRTTRIAYA